MKVVQLKLALQRIPDDHQIFQAVQKMLVKIRVLRKRDRRPRKNVNQVGASLGIENLFYPRQNLLQPYVGFMMTRKSMELL